MSLQVSDLHFSYSGQPLLDGVDLDVAAGESVFLVGPSGCGKSSLLQCIAGIERPTRGHVSLDGELLDDVPVYLRRVGFMFQEPALFPHLDVAGNVSFGMRYRTTRVADEQTEAKHFLQMVGLESKADARVDELSGGERQRVALARTLAAKPRAVLLDEPLSALDQELRVELGKRIKDLLAEAGIPALWVTHDHEEAMRLGDRIFQMDQGAVAVKS